MDIFSIFYFVDGMISFANGFMEFHANINKLRQKEKRETLTHPDGRRYEGALLDGEAHGQGTLIYPDGTRCEGEFVHGELNGKVTINWPDGRRYEGDWQRKGFDDKVMPALPKNVCAEITCRSRFHPGKTAKIPVHSALASEHPATLERLGDSSYSLFDRWFCYQTALQHAPNLNNPQADRVLQKLSMLEAESDFPKVCFESVATHYQQAVGFCQQMPEFEELTAEHITTQLAELRDSRHTLQVCQQPDAFIVPLEQYLQQVFAQLIAQKPALRRQYPHVLAKLEGFLADRLRLRWEGTTNEYLVLAKPKLTIGRCDQPGKESDIFVLDAPEASQKTYISRFHAILEYTPHGFQLAPDQNHYQIWLERDKQIIDVMQPTILENDDLIWLGKQAAKQGVALRYGAYYDANASEAEQVVDSQATLDENCVKRRLIAAKLEIEQGTPRHGAIILYAAVCPIGRDAANPLCLPDNRVSRSQAVIMHQQGGFWLKDAGSRNGTWLNQEPCTELTPIVSGDAMQFGKSVTLRVL